MSTLTLTKSMDRPCQCNIGKLNFVPLEKLRLLKLVYWGLTPQQQPGSYRGGDDDSGGGNRSTRRDTL